MAGREVPGGLRKARELLAFLAVYPAGATGDQVSEALWPGAPPGDGTAQRDIAVRKLREMLRTATGLHDATFVTLAADRYRLDSAVFDIDIWGSSGRWLAARHASGEDAQLGAFWRAVEAYHGPLADATGYDRAEPYAEQARRRALGAWARIAEITAPREAQHAFAALETALGHDPYNEFLHQRIMRLQAAGCPDAVRRTLSLLQARLGGLGVTPRPAEAHPGRVPARHAASRRASAPGAAGGRRKRNLPGARASGRSRPAPQVVNPGCGRERSACCGQAAGLPAVPRPAKFGAPRLPASRLQVTTEVPVAAVTDLSR